MQKGYKHKLIQQRKAFLASKNITVSQDMLNAWSVTPYKYLKRHFEREQAHYLQKQ